MDTNSKLDTKNLVSAASEMKHVQAWKPVASTIHSAVYAMFFVKNRFTKLPENPPKYLKHCRPQADLSHTNNSINL